VVSSDKPPAAIPNLEAGLRSRFEGGMIAELTRPDRETRRRIIEHKSSWAGFPLPEEVVEFLTDRVPGVSVREIEGALVRLQAIASLSNRTIDLALAESAIGATFSGTRERLSAERVEALVAEELAVEPQLLRSPRRSARLVFARQVAMYLMRRQIGLPFAAIGERYGRDHTTVLHAVRAIEARRACNPEVRRLVTTLEEKL
jgi:chromosomal replication initiator protein